MDKVKIRIADYYGKPACYSVMPETIFTALELEYLKGEEYVEVDKGQFDNMVESYKRKMECKESHS